MPDTATADSNKRGQQSIRMSIHELAAQAAATSPDVAAVTTATAVHRDRLIAWLRCDSDHPPFVTERFCSEDA